MITIKKDYKRHTCTRDIPSILYPDLELYYINNGHISIHNNAYWCNVREYPLSLMVEVGNTNPVAITLPANNFM
jgi:hypothetical protein